LASAPEGGAGGVVPGVPLPILAVVGSAIVFAPLSSWLALQRGRSWAAWFFFGMVLGPIAVALLVAAPPGRCPACGTRLRGWPRACPGCGLTFTADVAAAAPEASGTAGPSSAEPAAGAASAPAGPLVPGRTARSARPADPSPARDPEPIRRQATSLGRRPTIEGQPTTASAPRRGPTVAILGSGIFMGGSAPLQIGSRYLLARVGSELQALGPMHMSPSAVAARVPLAGTETTVVADRVLITGTNGGRGPTLAFASVAAEPGVDFTERLKVRARRKAVAS
jgi:hypothetical protein